MTNVVFLCQGESGRGQMAATFFNEYAAGDIHALSASLDGETEAHPLAHRVMEEIGIPLNGTKNIPVEQINDNEINAVITVCLRTAQVFKLPLPGQPLQVDWKIVDPILQNGSKEETLDAFRKTRDTLRHLVDDFLHRGYLDAISQYRNRKSLILDSLAEGLVVHDIHRRILQFNSAAERITGYKRNDVIGHDCHDVFPDGICGTHCSFCGESPPAFETHSYDVHFITRDGEAKDLHVNTRAIRDPEGTLAGIIASLTDRTREHSMARRLGEINSFSGIIGRDHKMQELFDLIRSVADANAPVLVQGESGTGKELVAAAIHNEGPRATQLFVPVNCGALPEGLLESELFGHVRGAFTGAIRDKKGRFELADNGTIFLDEIGDITPTMQVKLLRVLQEGTFERVGDTKTMKVNVRLISATNKDLLTEIHEGRFREDLYYRLCVVPLTLPPLRDRRGDIPLLVEHILKRAATEAGRNVMTLSADALDTMLDYTWPGNIRELQNAIQYALVKCHTDTIHLADLPPAITGITATRLTQATDIPERSHSISVDTNSAPYADASPLSPPSPAAAKKSGRHGKLNTDTVRDALQACSGNKVAATKALGVSRATLYRFLDEHPELK